MSEEVLQKLNEISNGILRIGDILTAAFQDEIISYNERVKLTNIVKDYKQEIQDLKVNNKDLRESNEINEQLLDK